MNTIWKYPLKMFGQIQSIEMPRGALILTVQVQENAPVIWAEVCTDEPLVKRKIWLFETGQQTDEIAAGQLTGAIRYRGTVILDAASYVLHVYESTGGDDEN